MRMHKLFKNETFLLFVLYISAHGLILLNNGIFWDDWTLYNNDRLLIIDRFTRLGVPWVGYFHSLLLSFDNSIFYYRMLVFLSFLFSAIFLNNILKNIKEIDNISRGFIVIFFTLFPVNSARITFITLPYALCYFLFFFGFWMLTVYMRNGNILLRFLLILTFFISFTTSSLLVFYSLIIIYLLYLEKGMIFSGGLSVKRLLHYADLLILPLVYWVLKGIFFKPYGLFEIYNKITFSGILTSPVKIIISFYTSIIKVIYQPLNIKITFLIMITAGIIALSFKAKLSTLTKHKYTLFFLLFGLFAFYAAIFPYAIVGHVPDTHDWLSRHQLLVPLGASFIFFYSIQFIIRNELIKNCLYIFLIISFLFTNIMNYVDFQTDCYKEASLIENFKISEEMKNSTAYLFDDKASDMNANDRLYAFYEYTGMMKEAFKEETRFGEDFHHQSATKYNGDMKLYLSSVYNKKNYNPTYSEIAVINMTEFVPKKPEYVVIIEHGDYMVSINNLLQLKYQEIFNKDRFMDNIKRLTTLRFLKMS